MVQVTAIYHFWNPKILLKQVAALLIYLFIVSMEFELCHYVFYYFTYM